MKEIIEKIQAQWDAEPALMLNISPRDNYIQSCIFGYHGYRDNIPYIKVEERLITLLNHLVNYYFIIAETWQVNTNEVVCERNKHRSLHDIYLISKYYWQQNEQPEENFSLEKVIFALIELVDTKRIHTMYCGTTNRRVYRPNVNERIYQIFDTSIEPLKYPLSAHELATEIDFEKLCKYYNECKKEQLVIN